jgi:hypothetical protein
LVGAVVFALLAGVLVALFATFAVAFVFVVALLVGAVLPPQAINDKPNRLIKVALFNVFIL